MTRPGGALARRPLHFLWIADCSGSMSSNGKIQSLNNAAREALPNMRRVARENPNAQVLARVLVFADGARWEVPEPTPIDDFVWPELSAGGLTDFGTALELLATELQQRNFPMRSLPPVLVVLSDGYPTDDFDRGMRLLMEQPWGAKAVRIAIAIGREANLEILQRFIGDVRIAPLTARNPDELAHFMRWASTTVLQSASAPKVDASPLGNTTLISLPDALPVDASDLTW
jgi:uncharacterized protein YegL